MKIASIIIQEIKAFLDIIVDIRGPSIIPDKLGIIKKNTDTICILSFLILLLSLPFYRYMNMMPEAISGEITRCSIIPIVSLLLGSICLYEKSKNPVKCLLILVAGFFTIFSVAYFAASVGFDVSNAPPELFVYERRFLSYPSYAKQFRSLSGKFFFAAVVSAAFNGLLLWYEKTQKTSNVTYCAFCGTKLSKKTNKCTKCGMPTNRTD